MSGIRNHSGMNWAESAKWSNTHKGKPGGSSRKDDGWCGEAEDKKTLHEVKQHPAPQKNPGDAPESKIGEFYRV